MHIKAKAAFFLFTAIATTACSQNLSESLRARTWYVTGRLYERKPLVLATDSTPASYWQARFLTSGHLCYYELTRSSGFDKDGVETPPGTVLLDSSYTWKVKGDRMTIDPFNAVMR